MDQWLRPVFQRTRTPVQGTSTISDDNHEVEENMSRLRPSSRVSSYIGFRSGSTTINAPDHFRNIRIPENVYHKPSGNQMAETLKVVMMTRDLMKPVPVEYNACILHVLEAYHDLQEQLDARDRELEELKLAHNRVIEDFESLTHKWSLKEKDYQKEMKNLEVLLAKREGGMEEVTMARSKSLVHGARRAADIFEDGLDKIKRDAARYSSDKGALATDWDLAHPQGASEKTVATDYSSPKPKHLNIPVALDDFSRAPLKEGESFTDKEESPNDQQPNEHRRGIRLTASELDALRRKHAEEEMGVVFDSSSESDDTSSRSISALTMNSDNHKSIRSNFAEKPLPDIPDCQIETDFLCEGQTPDSPWVESGNGELSSSSRKGFSFRAGDDASSMLHKISKDPIRRYKSDAEPVGHSSRLSYVMTNDDVFTTSASARQSPSKDPSPDPRSISSSPGYDQLSYSNLRHQLGLQKTLARGDSTSSIVTAVRDNSGKSETGRKKTDKQGTAVMAAVRAIASSSSTKSNPNERVPTKDVYLKEGAPFKEDESESESASANDSNFGVGIN